MRSFLLYLAGARRDILDQVPSERSRFLGLGLSVLLSGIFTAVVAAGALTQINVNVALASAGGCLLGLLFLSLDSRLVAPPAARSRRVFAATPRVILALLCGTIFSTAIAIGSLGPEVDQQLALIRQRVQEEFSQQQWSSSLEKEIKRLQAESTNLSSILKTNGSTTLDPSTDPTLRNLNNQLSQAQAAENSAYNNWQCQLYGTSGNGATCPAGNGALAQAAERQYVSDEEQVTRLNQQIAARETQITSSNASAQNERLKEARLQLPGVNQALSNDQQTLAAQDASFNAANNNDNGLPRKIQALGELTGSNSFIRYYTLILFIFISIMECLPLLLMILQRSGSYEMLLEATQRREALRAKRSVRVAAGGALLEQVLERESLSAGQAPDRQLEAVWQAGTTDGTAEEIEDMALRGMLDTRATARPDAGQAAD